MAHILPVVVYGNGDLYREMFNAVAATCGDSVFGILFKLSLVLGGTWAIIHFSVQRSMNPLLRYLGLYYLAFFILLQPTATVQIIDRVNQDHAYSVANVPLGLAAAANLTTVIGDSLTRLMEKNFSLPDDLRYGHTGMVMASRLVTASTQFQVTDPTFSQSLQSFVHQCVFYDLFLHKYSWNELANTNDLWRLVSEQASPARTFVYAKSGGDAKGQTEIVTCKDGASLLSQDWKQALSEAEAKNGSRLLPDNPKAKTQLLSLLGTSYGFLTKTSQDAAALMQQNMVANALQTGVLQMGAATNAPAALEMTAFTKAQQQKRLTNTTVFDMAAYWLPLMKNVCEAMLLGAFVLVILMILMPSGLTILKYYFLTLFWFQCWAPLYAILNLFMNFYAHVRCAGIMGSQPALTLADQAGLAQVNADVAGLAGYLTLSVPLLAFGLMKGMLSVFSQATQYMSGVTQSAGSSGAVDAVTGNTSLGNMHYDTQSSFNTSANHFDGNARVTEGMMTEQLPGGSSLSMTPEGSMVMNNQAAMSSLGTSVNLAHAIREMASQQADNAYSSATTHAQAYSDSVSSGLRELVELGHHTSTHDMSAHGSSMTVSGGTSAALQNVQQLTERFASDHYVSTATATKYLGAAYASAKGGVSIPVIGSAQVGVRAEADHSHSHENRELTAAAHDFVQNTHYADNVDVAVRGVQEHQYRASTEAGERLSENVGSSFDKAEQARHEMVANLQQSESYREAASFSEENATSINSNANQAFLNWVETHAGMSQGQIETMMVNDPQAAQALAKRFTENEAEQYLHAFEGHQASSQQSINADFAHESQTLSSDATVTAERTANEAQVMQHPEAKTLHITKVDTQAESSAKAIISGSQFDLNTSKEQIAQKGDALKKVITEKNK
jgi:conjugal transfer mating pair stabilization protein TraG